MGKIRDQITIRSDRETVWNYLHAAGLRPRWDRRIQKISQSTNGPIGLGTRLRYHFRICGFRFWMDAEYTLFRDLQQAAISFDTTSWGCLIARANGSWMLDLGDRRDEVSFSTSFQYQLKYGWAGRWLDRHIFTRSVRQDTRQSLINLKREIEAQRKKEPTLNKKSRFTGITSYR